MLCSCLSWSKMIYWSTGKEWIHLPQLTNDPALLITNSWQTLQHCQITAHHQQPRMLRWIFSQISYLDLLSHRSHRAPTYLWFIPTSPMSTQPSFISTAPGHSFILAFYLHCLWSFVSAQFICVCWRIKSWWTCGSCEVLSTVEVVAMIDAGWLSNLLSFMFVWVHEPLSTTFHILIVLPQKILTFAFDLKTLVHFKGGFDTIVLLLLYF